jgi:hypothetical protein
MKRRLSALSSPPSTSAPLGLPSPRRATQRSGRTPPVTSPGPARLRGSLLPDEPEVEERREEDVVDDGARAVDRRRDREAPERHRDADRVEVELHPRAHEERACEELAGPSTGSS